MTLRVTKKEVNEVKDQLKNGVQFINEVADYQFILRPDGLMFRYQNGKYKFYNDLNAFARAIVRTTKRGW